MTLIQGFPFVELHYDDDGKPSKAGDLAALTQLVTSEGATDVILIAHGFRNDEQDATQLYTKFLTTFRAHLSRAEFQDIANRKYAVGGVFWKSKAFDESPGKEGAAQSADTEVLEREAARAALEEARDTIACNEQRPKLDAAIGLLDKIKGDASAQDKIVSLILSLTDDIPPDPTEGLEQIRAKDGQEILSVLQTPIILPTAPKGDSDGGTAGFAAVAAQPDDGGAQSFRSIVGSIFGAVNTFLNVTTWYVMKNRAGVVGANGVAAAVRTLKGLPSAPRVHLVGHSLGGRLMASCAKALASPPSVHPDSLTLLEAAFSHYGFSAKGPHNPEGFFRAVVTGDVVSGPAIATFSSHDTVVGLTYAVASRLAGDNSKAIGDAHDEFGGIGRNGAQDCDVGIADVLHLPGTAYKLPINKIVSLDGSDGLIMNHSDITNPNVTYAFASVVAQT